MNKKIIFLSVVLFSCRTIVPASHKSIVNPNYVSLKKFKVDTLQYVKKNFIEGKEKYSNKELKYLLSDLEIPVKEYIPGNSNDNMFISPTMTLLFHEFNEVAKRSDEGLHPVRIIINWKNPLPSKDIDSLRTKNWRKWTKDEADYFGKQIVQDIMVVNF